MVTRLAIQTFCKQAQHFYCNAFDFQALNLHKHSSDDGGHGHEGHAHEDPLAKGSYLWKCISLIAGIYGFYLFELFMHICNKGHSHSHGLVRAIIFFIQWSKY